MSGRVQSSLTVSFRIEQQLGWRVFFRSKGDPKMWELSVPWYDLVLRAGIVYTFLLILLRVTGKRQVGQLAPFDLVLLLVIANAVQNAMVGADEWIPGGIILCLTLVGINSIVGFLTFKSKRFESLIEGRPQILVHNGKIDGRVMQKERITNHELMAAIRRAGAGSIDHVHFAILENNGLITVQTKGTNQRESDLMEDKVSVLN